MTNTLSNSTSAPSAELEIKVFSKALFGFKRDDVLSYIERINNEFDVSKNSLLDSIKSLEENLSATRQDKDILLEKTKELCESLECVKENHKNAQQIIQDMRIELDKANDEAASFKSRLFSKEQESVVLKADNSRLNAGIEKLSAALAEFEAKKDEIKKQEEQAKIYANEIIEKAKLEAQTIKNSASLQLQKAQAVANEEAEIIKIEAAQLAASITNKASNDAVALVAAAKQEQNSAKLQINGSAQSIANSVSTLKGEIASVDAQIAKALQDMQRLTGGISNALAETEKGLETLGVQLQEYPKQAPQIKQKPVQKRVIAQTAKHTLADSILDKLTRILK